MRILTLIFCFSTVMLSCDKGPGEGGLATLQGRVRVRDYNASFTVFLAEFFAKEKRVYIIYGEDEVYNDDFRTDYNGNYAFRNLRPGKYRVFTYGKDSTFQSSDGIIPVFVEVNIERSDRLVIAPELVILD
jgi:hypothetical protein